MRLPEKRGTTCRCCFSSHFAIDQTTHRYTHTYTHTQIHTHTTKQQHEQLVLSDFWLWFSLRLIKNAEQQMAKGLQIDMMHGQCLKQIQAQTQTESRFEFMRAAAFHQISKCGGKLSNEFT